MEQSLPQSVRLALGILVFLAASAASAEVYRWVDENGVVHYGDRPAAGAQAVDVKPPPPAQTPPPTEADESPQDNAASERVRAEQCEKARARLQSYQDAERLLVADDEGGQRELSAEERVDAIVRAEEQVAALCEED